MSGLRGEQAVAVRHLGQDDAVLAVAGPLGPADRERLDAVVATLVRGGTRHLVVDLGGLEVDDERTVRLLGHVRIRLLAAGMRVQWCRAPAGVARELRAAAVEAWGDGEPDRAGP